MIYFHRILIVLGFKDTPTLVGHFVSSPNEREREIEEMVEEIKERDRGEGRMNDSEETEEIKKIFPIYPYLLQGQQALPNCKPISVGRPGDAKYTTPLLHPTTPLLSEETTVQNQVLFPSGKGSTQ